MKKIMVTGGCGFIGSCFVRNLVRQGDFEVVNYDKLTYAGNPENVKEVANSSNYSFVLGDICDRGLLRKTLKDVDFVVNFAAESHVDRSIIDPAAFIDSNVKGVYALLDEGMKAGIEKFLQISTDECYGSTETGVFTETSLLHPRNPYSATKAGGEMIVNAFQETHGMFTLITRGSNTYGPYHFPEKLIPLFVVNLLHGKKVPLYGDGLNVREWIYVEDHCNGILKVLLKGKSGEVYNVGGGKGVTNIDLTKKLLELTGRDESFIEYVEDRKGHDKRYALDSSKIERELGWKAVKEFDLGLKETVEWIKNNESWWKPLLERRAKELKN
ncbi:MAG: dTDP-glucose 4,6-dehydratase [archaeon]